MNELLERAIRKPALPLAGYWHPVLFSPEPATGERITVGLALRKPDGTADFRWLRSFDRLRRVFGEQSATHLPFLIRHAQGLVESAQAPDTAHLVFGETRELWSDQPEADLDELFRRFVPLAREFEARPASIPAIPNKRLCATVYDRLKRSANPRAANLIPQNPLLRSAERPARYLHVPIQGSGRFATIVSANSKNASTIDKNVFPAVAELHAAARIHKIRRTAVFLLRPDEKLYSEDEYDAIDAHFHQTMFILKNEGVIVTAEISPELVADAVEAWGLAA